MTSTVAARMLRTTTMRLSLATRRCGSSSRGSRLGCGGGGGRGPSYLARSIGACSGTSSANSSSGAGSSGGGGITPVGKAPGGTLGGIRQASAFAATTTFLGQPTSAILQPFRPFSSSSSSPSSSTSERSEAPPILPTQHSRRQPPPSVVDIAGSSSSALLASTHDILSSRIGTLYSYDPNDSNDDDAASGKGGASRGGAGSSASSSFFDSAAGGSASRSGSSQGGGKGGKNKLSKAQEYDIGLAKSDSSRQYVEWLLRGHAALVEGTVEHARIMVETDAEMNASEADTSSSDGAASSSTVDAGPGAAVGGAYPRDGPAVEEGGGGAEGEGSDEASGAEMMSPTERINIMMRLLERIEEEGRIYVALRARIKANQFGGGGASSEQAAIPDEDDATAAAASSSGKGGSGYDTSSSDSISGYDSSSSSDSSTDSSSSDSSSSDSESEDEDDEEGSNDQDAAAIGWRTARLIERYGAPPGPSIGMYDTVLDTIAAIAASAAAAAASTSSTTANGNISSTTAGIEQIHQAKKLFDKAMMRHFQDGGPNANNIHTMPTPMTYNAVLRTCANVAAANSMSGMSGDAGKGAMVDERVRDEALEVAFNIYDALGQSTTKATTGKRTKKASKNRQVVQVVQRNSATYAYMLQIVTYCIPPSETRGNIAYGLWLNATSEDEVLDDFVFQAYIDANRIGGSNGTKFDGWVDKLESVGISQDKKEEGGGTKLPQKWWRNRKVRRMKFVGMEKMKMEQEGGMVMY